MKFFFRIRIMHNIGLVFVKMGQYSETCNSFEYIMQEQPNFQTGLDLVTAYYASGDIGLVFVKMGQ